MARVLETFESSSSSKIYEVTEDDKGIVYCTCPGWRFQKLPKEARACTHMKKMGMRGDSMLTGTRVGPTPKADPREMKAPITRPAPSIKAKGPVGARARSAAAKATRERKDAEAKGRLTKIPFGFMLSQTFEADRMKGDFVAEMKYDGALTMMADGRLYSRKGHDITHRFPEVPKLQNVVLIGEMAIVDDATGTTDFERFLTRNTDDEMKIAIAARDNPARFFVFDMIALGHSRESESLVSLPFKTRRTMLEKYWKEAVNQEHETNLELVQQISVSSPDDVDTLVKRCQDLGIEGVMVKNLAAPYEGGKRTHHWMKAKTWQDRMFAIRNHGPTGVGDGHVISIELDNGAMQDVNCGSAEMRKQLADECDPRAAMGHTCVFDADIKFLQESSSGKLRFPSLKRLVKK